MMDSTYFQDTFSALVKSLYYERGRGAYFRATMVGRDYIDREEIAGRHSRRSHRELREVPCGKGYHSESRL